MTVIINELTVNTLRCLDKNNVSSAPPEIYPKSDRSCSNCRSKYKGASCMSPTRKVCGNWG